MGLCVGLYVGLYLGLCVGRPVCRPVCRPVWPVCRPVCRPVWPVCRPVRRPLIKQVCAKTLCPTFVYGCDTFVYGCAKHRFVFRHACVRKSCLHARSYLCLYMAGHIAVAHLCSPSAQDTHSHCYVVLTKMCLDGFIAPHRHSPKKEKKDICIYLCVGGRGQVQNRS